MSKQQSDMSYGLEYQKNMQSKEKVKKICPFTKILVKHTLKYDINIYFISKILQ